MLTNALYYPWMHFQDDNWVKLALLMWDSVARVRARDIEDRDSDLVRQVRNETDLLYEISPSERDLSYVERNVAEVLEVLGDRVAARYRQKLDDWDEDRGVYSYIAPPSQQYSAPDSNTWYAGPEAPVWERDNDRVLAPDRLTWVYCGPEGSKVGRLSKDLLVTRELGLPWGSWLGMHPKLASIYRVLSQ